MISTLDLKSGYSPTSIIRTRDAKKIQGQSTHCDYVTGLRMRSKPTSHRCHARTSCCTAIKFSLTLKEVKRCMVSVLSIEDGIKIVKTLDKSVNDTFLHV